MRDHIIICGYGSTGQSAAEELVSRGTTRGDIAVVDLDGNAVELASRQGFVGITGDATHREVLVLAGVRLARSIIVTPARDDTAVLITLTARELTPTARIVAGGRRRYPRLPLRPCRGRERHDLRGPHPLGHRGGVLGRHLQLDEAGSPLRRSRAALGPLPQAADQDLRHHRAHGDRQRIY